MSADPVAIHDFGSDINPYAYVHGTPLMGVDPDGRFAFLIVIAVIIICAAIAGGSNLAVQANTVGWNRVNWGIKGVAGSALIGAAAGAATMGAGAAVGAAIGAGTGAVAAAGAVGVRRAARLRTLGVPHYRAASSVAGAWGARCWSVRFRASSVRQAVPPVGSRGLSKGALLVARWDSS